MALPAQTPAATPHPANPPHSSNRIKGNDMTHSANRRGFLRHATALGLASALPFAGDAHAARAEELRVLFPGGSWKEYFEKTFANDFAKQNNIKFIFRAGHRFGS